MAVSLSLTAPGIGEDMFEKLIDARELAERLSVPIGWIYDRTRDNGPEQLPHYKLGKYIRFAESEVMDYLRLKAVDRGANS